MKLPKITSRQVTIGFTLGVALAIYPVIFWPYQKHAKWVRALQDRIVSLAERRPDGVTREQWAACIHWTWNLNGNCGSTHHHFRADARDRFLAEFDRRLRGKVDLRTIDWIWDQYCLYSTCGAEYSRKYRPTTPEQLKYAAEDPFKENNLDEWLEDLRRRRERK